MQIGAPTAEPTFAEIRKTHMQDIEKEEETGNLKSSMVAPVGEGSDKQEEEEGFLTTEAFTTTVKSPFGTNDGETSDGRLLSWQQ